MRAVVDGQYTAGYQVAGGNCLGVPESMFKLADRKQQDAPKQFVPKSIYTMYKCFALCLFLPCSADGAVALFTVYQWPRWNGSRKFKSICPEETSENKKSTFACSLGRSAHVWVQIKIESVFAATLHPNGPTREA